MLSDRFGRTIDYLRVSVTDRCDLRCQYCIPKGFKDFETPAHWLTFDEVTRVVAAFGRLGVSHVRLTGGEPLLRRKLPELAKQIATLPGIDDLSLSTNGTQLPRYAVALREAGVKRLNVSLDALNAEDVRTISGADSLAAVLTGLSAAKGAGFTNIKINMVPIAGVNDHAIESMVAFCIEQGFVLRLIEAMPMGPTGQAAHSPDFAQILDALSQRFGLKPVAAMVGVGPARYWRSRDNRFTLGLITPLSQHFCASCNRVRLAVDGTLYMCLGQEARYSLRTLLRAGISDDALEQAIRAAIELKPERHEFVESPQKIVRIMAKTGG